MRRLAPTKKRVLANTTSDMDVIHTLLEVLYRNTIDLSNINSNSSSLPKLLLRVFQELHLMRKELFSIPVKRAEVAHRFGDHVADHLYHRWLRRHTILLIIILTNTIPIIISSIIIHIIHIISTISSRMDILVNITFHTTSSIHRLIITSIMAIRDLHNMEGIMDTIEVQTDKQDVKHTTIIANRSAYFLQWRPTRIACLIGSAMYARKW
mmetsp:Transcript_52908/g.59911  ORF Transcript_52908/g.59911 Transcript_52908/m.59911 type:complete len:210 (-) Transcript_52908:506-1135(-)